MKALNFVNSVGQEIAPGDTVVFITKSRGWMQIRTGTYVGVSGRKHDKAVVSTGKSRVKWTADLQAVKHGNQRNITLRQNNVYKI